MPLPNVPDVSDPDVDVQRIRPDLDNDRNVHLESVPRPGPIRRHRHVGEQRRRDFVVVDARRRAVNTGRKKGYIIIG